MLPRFLPPSAHEYPGPWDFIASQWSQAGQPLCLPVLHAVSLLQYLSSLFVPFFSVPLSCSLDSDDNCTPVPTLACCHTLLVGPSYRSSNTLILEMGKLWAKVTQLEEGQQVA